MDTPVTRYLKQKGIDYTVKTHRIDVFTSEDAAEQRGVKLSQIVKTILLSDGKGRIIVAVMPGDRRLDSKKTKKVLNVKNLRFMNRDMVQKELGVVAGAISPVGSLPTGLEMVVDPAVFAEDMVDISSGGPSAGIELKSRDLKDLLPGALVAEITP